MQKICFILNITENKHKSSHPEGENQNLYKHTQGKSREQAEQGSRQTSGKYCETYQPRTRETHDSWWCRPLEMGYGLNSH